MRLAYLYPEHLGYSPARLIQVAGTCRALAAQPGVELHLLVGRYPGVRRRLEELGLGPAQGINPHLLPMLQPGPGARLRASWHMPFYMAAARVLKRLEPDAAIVRHLKLGAWMLRHLPQLRLVYEAHELFWITAQEEKMAPARVARLKSMEQEVLSRAWAVVAISQPLAEEIRAWARPRGVMAVIPCGVDEDFFLDPARARDPALAVYTGGLGEWKGVGLVVEAAAKVQEARVVIMGGEPESAEYQRLARRIQELGLTGRLQLKPKAPRQQVRALLQQASIGLWPGTARRAIAARFTSPLKVFEYMAAGCAVVAPRVPAAQGLVGEGVEGLLFEPDDPASLAEVLGRLVSDPSLAQRLGSNGARKAQEFTWQRRAERLVEVIKAGR